jgi:hypothetical protein
MIGQLDTGAVKRLDDLLEAVDDAADGAGARFHARDRREGNAGLAGKRFLVDAK